MPIDQTLRGLQLQIDEATDSGVEPQLLFSEVNVAGQDWAIARLRGVAHPDFGGELVIETSAGTGMPRPAIERLRVDASGNVGIGTDSPSHRLDVSGIVNAQGFLQNGASLRFSQWDDIAGGIQFLGGNVGVGLSQPRTQLHVLNRISTGLDFFSAGAITFFPPDGFAWFHVDNGPAGGRPIGRLRISHGANPGDHELLTITQTGVVGIGTPNPQVTFHVVGNRIRLTNPVAPNQFIDLRADGAALDVESSLDLFLNTNGRRVVIRNLVQQSSRALKEDIAELSAPESVRLLEALTPVRFHYRNDEDRTPQLGFVAEDVPEAVACTERKAIRPLSILALLCSVVREQQRQLADMQAELQRL